MGAWKEPQAGWDKQTSLCRAERSVEGVFVVTEARSGSAVDLQPAQFAGVEAAHFGARSICFSPNGGCREAGAGLTCRVPQTAEYSPASLTLASAGWGWRASCWLVMHLTPLCCAVDKDSYG